jgi:WD40-like Beta Propeller Repeat
VKRELERIDIPGEHEARERTWAVVASAFGEREPVPRPSHWPRVAAVAIALAALAAAALSSPGRAVLDEVREVVGIERAQPALFSLPTPGRLLVASDAGVWVVREDGSKRLLGEYREASWSPFGRFVVAARENELAALEPDGDVRWTLARPGAASPRWTGSETDTRIAYQGLNVPRVVAGDGTDDAPVCAVSARRIAPAWRPGSGFALALVAPSGEPYVVDLDRCVVRWRGTAIARPRRLEWSTDGTRLLVVGASRLIVLDARTGRVVGTTPGVDGAFRPGSRTLARIFQRGDRSRLIVGRRGVVFSASGRLEGPVWSPDGRWLLVGWPTADQWVFVRADGKRIRAVSNVSEQFRSRSFPRVEGWCCG